ncbi:hypothetical protein GCM10011488_35140 [Steroidobacter agaridevorans]|nr:hypothetical protein GCM10011488_35140 [Steroidobacter agaridevorans]
MVRSSFLALMLLAAPAVLAQSEGPARQAIGECIEALEPDAIGLEAIEKTCPEIRVALEQLGLTDLVSEDQLSLLSRDGLHSLHQLALRYEQEPEHATIGSDTLAPVLESLREPPVAEQSLSWYQRLERWLREILDRKPSNSSNDSWLSRWLKEYSLPDTVRWGLIYGSMALMVLLALGIVINEVRTAARGRRRKSAAKAANAADVPFDSRSAGTGLDAGGERLSALLRLLIATLVDTGRLQGAQSLTHRELAKRARFDDSTQRESFQKIAQLAERETFSGKEVASDDLADVLRVGRTLDAQLKGAAT